jgi:hypothetical protein
MPHAVIITGPGFQDHDVIYTYYRLREARVDVDIATKEDPATGHRLHVTELSNGSGLPRGPLYPILDRLLRAEWLERYCGDMRPAAPRAKPKLNTYEDAPTRHVCEGRARPLGPSDPWEISLKRSRGQAARVLLRAHIGVLLPDRVIDAHGPQRRAPSLVGDLA